MSSLIGKDVYLRVTDNATGSSSVRHHRAWDVDRFIASQREQHRAEGEKEGDAMRYQVSLATAQEYRQANRRAAS